jgi:hypothetical protein
MKTRSGKKESEGKHGRGERGEKEEESGQKQPSYSRGNTPIVSNRCGTARD